MQREARGGVTHQERAARLSVLQSGRREIGTRWRDRDTACRHIKDVPLGLGIAAHGEGGP